MSERSKSPSGHPIRTLWPHVEQPQGAQPSWMDRHVEKPTTMFQDSPTTGAPPTGTMPTAAEIEAIRQDAVRRGFASGEAELEAALERLAVGLARVEHLGRTQAGPWSGELVEMALIIASELVGQAVSTDADLLAGLVEEALTAVADERDLVVRMHPDDQKLLLARHASTLPEGCRVLGDPSLARGGCMVESRNRVVDAKVETRLDVLREGLTAVMIEAGRQRQARLAEELAAESESASASDGDGDA